VCVGSIIGCGWRRLNGTAIAEFDDAVRQLGDIVRRLPAKRVFIVTDTTLAKVGVLTAATAPLRDAGIEIGVFDGGQAEPSLLIIEQSTEEARRFGPDASPFPHGPARFT